MELILAAAVGGIVTQGMRYAWSYVITSNTQSDNKIPEQKNKVEVNNIRERHIDAPPTTIEFLNEIQLKRQSLRPTTPTKKEKIKTDLQLIIERRRPAMCDSIEDISPI